jgi:leader peptidase (prepilin peptidase)/N-methyltransferase
MHHVLVEIYLWVLGLCVGSFLNVVVYRLPTGLSVFRPRRSFCPRCRVSIAWFDNVPLLSWLLLAGRCRHCRQPISAQYPLVEGLTGLAFVLVYHLLFVTQSADLGRVALPGDWPLLLAWLALVAGLVACSAMDIVSYAVDVRVTSTVLWVAIVLHALWPRADWLPLQARSAVAAATLAAFLVSGLAVWWRDRRLPVEEPAEEPPADDATTEAPGSRPAGLVTIFAFTALAGWLVCIASGTGRHPWPQVAPAAALLAIFGAIVLAGGQRRSADLAIRAAIEEERPHARRMALRELVWLLPMIVVAVLVFAAVHALPRLTAAWMGLVAWSPGIGLTPVAGAAYAIHGAMIGALAGWALRIVFTLVFGREAFGVGDIHILAAAGAAAGWDIALLGLLLSVGIAMLGWLLNLLRKCTVMIPFGPWLAVGFVLALWWQQPATRIAGAYQASITYAWRERPDLLLTGCGLMLVGIAAAIALARLVRRWVAPDTT